MTDATTQAAIDAAHETDENCGSFHGLAADLAALGCDQPDAPALARKIATAVGLFIPDGCLGYWPEISDALRDDHAAAERLLDEAIADLGA